MKIVLIVVLLCILSILSAGQEYMSGDQSLLLFPTAYTMPQGSYAFTSFELLIMQFTAALTNSTHLTAVSVFPINMDMLRTFTPGIKQRYLHGENIQAAVMAGYMIDFGILNLGNVISFGKPEQSLHLGVNYTAATKQGHDTFVFSLGGRKDLSRRIALISEIASSMEAFEDEFDGILTIGIRFKGEKMSWDLGGFRPLSATDGNFLLFPLIKATIVF